MSTVHPTSSHIRILLAAEDEAVLVFLAINLTADGYRVATAVDRDDALCQLRSTGADLILVDVNGQTLALIDWVRNADPALCAIASDTPVIVLTSHPDEIDRARLLERGGDDVIAKPFSYPELRARIAAVLRRTAPRQPQPVLTAGPLRLDPHRRTVTVDDRVVELSAIEYRLLRMLASEPSRVFTRQELMADVWGYSTGRTRTLDSHVISSTVSGVVCVGCEFCPGRRPAAPRRAIDQPAAGQRGGHARDRLRGGAQATPHTLPAPARSVKRLGARSARASRTAQSDCQSR